MNKLLQLKHWQLFVLLFGLPIISQVVSVVTTAFFQLSIGGYFGFLPIAFVLFNLVFVSWLYAMGTNLNKKLPDFEEMNLTWFKIFLLIYIVCKLLSYGVWSNSFTGVFGVEQINGMFYIIVEGPLYLVSIFCILYSYYFCGKSLKSVERQWPVRFGDYAGEFFLILIFPIGVWYLQPRINKIFEDNLQ